MNITFVCTGNTCRSPMAQVLFAHMAQNSNIGFSVDSAGISAVQGQPAAANAVLACKEQGLDLQTHRAKNLVRANLSKTDLFVVMTMQHARALMDMGVSQDKIYILNVSDPFGGSIDVYRQCCDDIKAQLIILLELIKRQEQKKN